MLSVSKPLQASSAVKYYERDNYYLESQGTWQGGMASELGLDGEIEREYFSAYLRGFSPEGQELVASAGKVDDQGQPRHRAGIDLTFSAPKSVSVLSCKDRRVEIAFHKALSNTLTHIERDFVATRTRKGRQDSIVESTGKALWSTFTHRTSRELDPQLHAHCILFNLTQDSEGKTKTVHNDAIYKNQKYFGQYFRNEMAKQICDLGYRVKVTDRKQGFFEVSGVDREIIDAFSKRRLQVEEHARELKEMRFCDLPDQILRRWVDQRMRNERMKPDFSKRYEEEVKALHTSTERAFKGLRHAELTEFAALNSRLSKENVTEEYVLDLVEKTCEECGTTLDGVVTKAQDAALDPANYQPPQSVGELLRTAITCLTENQSAFKKTDLTTVALRLGIGHYTETDIQTEFSRALENGDLRHLGKVDAAAASYDVYSSREMIAIESSVMDICRQAIGTNGIKVPSQAAQDFIAKTHSELVEQNGHGFTPGQKDAIKHITSTSCQFSVIQGDAGTGKSFSMLYAKQLLEGSGIKVRGLAPTGKATVELSESAEIADDNCGTIDTFLLKFAHADDDTKERLYEKNNEVWIVDEAGMCGSRKIHELMKVASFAGAKVVFVGDRKQFASIEAGELVARGVQGRIVSTDIAANSLTLSYVDPATGNESTKEVNLAANGDRLSTFNENAKNFGAGDKIVFLKNDKKVGVRNGQLADVESIDKHGNVVARIGKKRIDFNLLGKGGKQYNYIDHAFALSEYKSQGATVDRLVWHADTQAQVSSNSFYVAITRCKREVAVYTDDPERLKQRVKEEQHKYSTLDFTEGRKPGGIQDPVQPMPRIMRNHSTFGRQKSTSSRPRKRARHDKENQPSPQQSQMDI